MQEATRECVRAKMACTERIAKNSSERERDREREREEEREREREREIRRGCVSVGFAVSLEAARCIKQ